MLRESGVRRGCSMVSDVAWRRMQHGAGVSVAEPRLDEQGRFHAVARTGLEQHLTWSRLKLGLGLGSGLGSGLKPRLGPGLVSGLSFGFP